MPNMLLATRKTLCTALFVAFLPIAAAARAEPAETRSKTSDGKTVAQAPRKPGSGPKSGPRGTLLAAKNEAPASLTSGSSSGDPFARLKVVVPRDKLPPLATVRVHDRSEARERAGKQKIKVLVQSVPGGASVSWGPQALGKTPIALVARAGSTPVDLVLRRKGYMTLRTRVQRRISRTYTFKLSPAKFR